MTLKITTIVGARPQFIKAAAVSRRIADGFGGAIEESIIHTGQHFDHAMSAVFFEELSIPEPTRNLEVRGGAHGKTTGAMLAAIEQELLDSSPDALMVYGDTNSTLAGALAAAKLHIPVIHVEAGLRSFNKKMPEEINRILTDHVSTLMFCPSESSRKILQDEGLTDGVHVVGDVMFDVVRFYAEKLAANSFGLDGPFALMTAHRAENTDDPIRLAGLAEGVGRIGLQVLFPVHPRTKNALEKFGVALPPNVTAIDPLSYKETLAAIKASQLILTDSGGLQKEAFYMGRPCVTLRDETEWIELVEIGVNRLAGCDPDKIATAALALLNTPLSEATPYGDGDAAGSLLEIVAESFK